MDSHTNPKSTVCAVSHKDDLTKCATICLDLSAAVDVYSDWVDACDAVAKANNEEGASGTTYTQRPGIQGTGGRGEADRDTYNDHDHEGYEGEGIVADDEYD